MHKQPTLKKKKKTFNPNQSSHKSFLHISPFLIIYTSNYGLQFNIKLNNTTNQQQQCDDSGKHDQQLIQIPVNRSYERSDRSKTVTDSDTKQLETVSTWRRRREGAAAGSDRSRAEAAFFMAMVAVACSFPVTF